MKRLFTLLFAIICGLGCLYAQTDSKNARTAEEYLESGCFVLVLDEATDMKTQTNRPMYSSRIEVDGKVGSVIWGSGDKIISKNHWNDNLTDKTAKVEISGKKAKRFSIEIDNAFNRGYRIEGELDAEGRCNGRIYYYNEVFCTYKGHITGLK